jgi:predicted Zn-dependent protease
VNTDDQRRLEAARGWLALGDWQSANDELEEIAPLMRAHADVLLLRAEIYLKAGKPHMAQPVTQTLVRDCGADWRTHYTHAQVEAQLGHFAESRAALERAFALADVRQRALDDPLLEDLWRNLG